MVVTPTLPEAQHQTSKAGFNTFHASAQIYCTIYLDVEYLSRVAEELPAQGEGRKWEQYVSLHGERGAGARKDREAAFLVPSGSSTPRSTEQVALIQDEKRRGFLSHLIISQA